jgi:hypothetical protein
VFGDVSPAHVDHIKHGRLVRKLFADIVTKENVLEQHTQNYILKKASGRIA